MPHPSALSRNPNWRQRLALGSALVLAGLGARAADSDFGPAVLPDLFIVFFPPVPTVYGQPIPEPPQRTLSFNGRALLAPEELVDFVGESIYPALSSRLYSDSLAKKLRERVDAYRAKRSELLNALLDKIAAVQHADPAALERELQAFAPTQTARIEILEQEAEQLRRDLIRGGLLSPTVDWNISRSWRIGDADLVANPLKAVAEFQAVRAAAYYQDGLGTEQRGLLRELTIELAAAAQAARSRVRPPTENLKAMFFAPETARLQLPTPLTPDLVAKIGRFNGEKAALKQELLTATLELDRASDAKHTSRFTALTEKQWPRISALESLAEEIRRDLAALTEAPAPWLPPITAALRERIETYTRDRHALTKDLTDAMLRAHTETIVKLPPGKRERVVLERAQRLIEERRQATAEFMRQNAGRIEEMHQRYGQIRATLAEIAATLKDPRTGQPMTVESLLAAYHVAMDRFDLLGREDTIYSLYKTAMLQPGLAPAQRRLLFVAAQVSLAQALPTGESTTTPLSRPRLW